jgi:hypothetical protein
MVWLEYSPLTLLSDYRATVVAPHICDKHDPRSR